MPYRAPKPNRNALASPNQARAQNSPSHPCESSPPILRQAELVANGEIPVPANLSSDDLNQFVATVQSIRRHRLIDYVARAIAYDIHQCRPSKKR